jgi:hypothetical protein
MFLLTKNQMAIKKVPNLKGMKQQHFSNPSPILWYIMKGIIQESKEKKRRKE